MQTLSEIETSSFVHTAMKYYKITKGKRNKYFTVISVYVMQAHRCCYAVPRRSLFLIELAKHRANTIPMIWKRNKMQIAHHLLHHKQFPHCA